ncbi:MAG: hypothetical protein Kow0042_13700 [Calditrichia bacterium]
MWKLAIFLTVIFMGETYAQQLNINTVSPAQSSNSAAPNTTIQIEFNLPVDTTSIADKIVIQGSKSSLHFFEHSTNTQLNTIYLQPYYSFLLGEKVRVTVKDSVQGLNGEAFAGYQWNFHIKPSLPTFPYFTPPTIYNQFKGIYINSADINDDGVMDILISYPTLKILKNDGFGNFSIFQELYDGYDKESIVFDFDLDGFKNLWVFPHFYEQGNDGFFHYDTTIYRGIAQIKDMNRDGYPDFVIGELLGIQDSLYFIGIHYNNGQFKPLVQIDTVVIDKGVQRIITDDFNNDGIEDIAYCTSVFPTPSGVGGHNSFRILYRSSTGDTLYRAVYNGEDFPFGDIGMPFDIQSADFNNDGFADILLMTNVEDYVIFNDTQGGFNVDSPTITGGGDSYHVSNIGDASADGWLDLIYNVVIGPGENAYTFFVHNNNAQFNTGSLIYERDTAYVYYSTTGDFNNDGALDIATTWWNGLYIHFNSEVNKINLQNGKLIKEFTLSQNYPNPFNLETAIEFFLPKPGIVESLIYDINGKEVKRYPKTYYHTGRNKSKWNGKNNTGKEVSSGTYIWKFKTQGTERCKKIILVK